MLRWWLLLDTPMLELIQSMEPYLDDDPALNLEERTKKRSKEKQLRDLLDIGGPGTKPEVIVNRSRKKDMPKREIPKKSTPKSRTTKSGQRTVKQGQHRGVSVIGTKDRRQPPKPKK